MGPLSPVCFVEDLNHYNQSRIYIKPENVPQSGINLLVCNAGMIKQVPEKVRAYPDESIFYFYHMHTQDYS